MPSCWPTPAPTWTSVSRGAIRGRAGRFHGLDGGRSPGAEIELARWIETAARLGHTSCASPPAARRPAATNPPRPSVARLVAPTRRAADRAASSGVRLALENHGDLRVADILELFERVDRPDTLGVCLDNVNLIRVGDDMAGGTRALAPYTLLVQLKDHLPGTRRCGAAPCARLSARAWPISTA